MVVQHDVLEYMVPQGGFMYEKHLASTQHPLYVFHEKGMITYVKADQGHPWDILVYDDNFVYMLVTEWDWSDPKTYKRFHTTAYYRGGIPHCPRHIYFENPPLPLVINDTTYKIYKNCVGQDSQSLGPASTKLFGPFLFNYGDDLGVLESIGVDYQWTFRDEFNNQTATLERFFYAKPYGWVRWEQYEMVPGTKTFTLRNISNFNQVVLGITAKNMPCIMFE